MNIALLTKNFNRTEKDAAITTVLNLARALKKKGHNAIIISEGGFKEYTGYRKNHSYEIINNIEVFRPYWLPWFRTDTWFLDPTTIINRIFARAEGVKYVEKKKNIKFDVIHSFGAAPITAVSTIFAKILCPYSKTIHSVKAISAHQKYFFSLGKPYFQYIYRFIDKITVPLPSMKKNLEKYISPSKIKIINSFIDLNRFFPRNKFQLRKKYGLANKNILLYFGPLGPHKGTDYLFNAIPLIQSKISHLKVILAHPAYFTQKKKKHIESFHIKNCIELKENQKGKHIIEDYINMAHVVVLPYTTLAATEANPLCLLESIACKTPVVTTDLPELRELFKPNIDVIMACPKDSKSLADNIIKVLQNKNLQNKLTNNAFKKIHAFDINNAVEKLIKNYKELISK
jgi:glycosyltransferase involved in cell wall biosynthesis